MFIHDLAKYIEDMQEAGHGFVPVNDIAESEVLHLVHTPERSGRERNATLFSLPWQLILKGMHVHDLLQLAKTCVYFENLIKTSNFLWRNVSYEDTWPNFQCLRHYEKGAGAGNTEALTKMAMAYLYHEGLSPTEMKEMEKVEISGKKATQLLFLLENQTSSAQPFTWIFFRPPWSAVPSAKQIVFEETRKQLCKVDRKNRDMAVSCARALGLLGTEEGEAQSMAMMEKAAAAGSPHARLALWEAGYPWMSLDPGLELTSLRELREIADMGSFDAKLKLAKFYASGKCGGVTEDMVKTFMQTVFKCAQTHHHVSSAEAKEGGMTSAMRYILIDWLIEVAAIKDLSPQLLHMTVAMMDRFLEQRVIQRSSLQLLGISTMVISSRFLGSEVITIREAAWLTDQTYKYEEVVRMITDIISVLQGVIKVPTIIDYVEILCLVLDLKTKDCCLATYISEMCLLHEELRVYCAEQIAASCVLLTQLIHSADNPWPSQAEKFTQYTKTAIAPVASVIYKKCYTEKPMVDHRSLSLEAVKQRFASDRFLRVSDIEIPEDLDSQIIAQLTDFEMEAAAAKFEECWQSLDVMIFSPSRMPGKTGSRRIREECKCLTPDNSSAEEDNADKEDCFLSEFLADTLEDLVEECAGSSDQACMEGASSPQSDGQDSPSFGGFRVSNVSISPSFHAPMWTQTASVCSPLSSACSSGGPLLSNTPAMTQGSSSACLDDKGRVIRTSPLVPPDYPQNNGALSPVNSSTQRRFRPIADGHKTLTVRCEESNVLMHMLGSSKWNVQRVHCGSARIQQNPAEVFAQPTPSVKSELSCASVSSAQDPSRISPQNRAEAWSRQQVPVKDYIHQQILPGVLCKKEQEENGIGKFLPAQEVSSHCRFYRHEQKVDVCLQSERDARVQALSSSHSKESGQTAGKRLAGSAPALPAGSTPKHRRVAATSQTSTRSSQAGHGSVRGEEGPGCSKSS